MDRPKRDALEDAMLARVLQVSLSPRASPVVFLESLSKELQEEGIAPLLSQGILERVLMDRLSILPLLLDTIPLHYLIDCYQRALDESRRVASLRDKEVASHLQGTLSLAQELLVSYVGLMVQNPDMFPQPPPTPTMRNPLSLLTKMLPDTPSGASDTFGTPLLVTATSSGLPHGFLDQLVKRFDGEGLEEILSPVFKDLPLKVKNMSPLGPLQGPLTALVTLVGYAPVARALVQDKDWLPANLSGRMLELRSVLGPFYRISTLPDLFGSGVPDVIQQCFQLEDPQHIPPRRQVEILASMQQLRAALHTLYQGLHEAMLALLRNTDTREKALEFLGQVIEVNKGRSKMQVDQLNTASHGFFFSLALVLLRLSEPFLDPNSSKMARIDPAYVYQTARLTFKDITALAASTDEVASWVDKRNYVRTEGFRQLQQHLEQEELRKRGVVSASGEPSTSGAQAPLSLSQPAPSPRGSDDGGRGGGGGRTQFPFICECFFMTARAVNLGIVKAIHEMNEGNKETSRWVEKVKTLEERKEAGVLNPEQLQQLERIKTRVKQLTETRLCFEAQVLDEELLQSALSFFRLMLTWLAQLAGGFVFPLPVPPPMEFASMPEHFVEDACDVLELVAQRQPKAFEGVVLDEILSFMVIFMGSPLHIKNPYLRSKFVAFLNRVLPSHCSTPGMVGIMTGLFEGHEIAQRCLVPNLLRLYVDIEFTGSHTQFYDKFNVRDNIADILEYLWTVPAHRATWYQFARAEEGGFYLKVMNMLVNDSIYLLDESLKKLPEIREVEVAMSDEATWQQQPEAQRLEREEQYHEMQNFVRWDMILSRKQLSMLGYTTQEITATLLRPEMVERIATMLNYFLFQLVGPQRRELKIKDPEKYEFRPKELVSGIVHVYVNLAKADTEDEFAKAIAADDRSYRDGMFQETAVVLRTHGLRPEEVEAFLALGEKCRAYRVEAMDMEAQLGDIPDEFLDPIQATLMTDPVTLPSSGITIDRAVIQRHLLSDQTDPFNRSFLSADMLEPNTKLKAEIEAYVASRTG